MSLNQKNIHFVIVGDAFDFWRRNSAKTIIENQDVFNSIKELNTDNIHYLIGNHDYYMFEWYQKYEDSYPFTVSKDLRLEDAVKSFILRMAMIWKF